VGSSTFFSFWASSAETKNCMLAFRSVQPIQYIVGSWSSPSNIFILKNLLRKQGSIFSTNRVFTYFKGFGCLIKKNSQTKACYGRAQTFKHPNIQTCIVRSSNLTFT
jgi:hypothetical protein